MSTAGPESDARERYLLPAEWSLHEACWLAWPSSAPLWPSGLARAQRCVIALCEAIAGRDGGERIELLVQDPPAEAQAREALAGLPVVTRRLPFGDIWMRDTAPLFVHDSGGRVSPCGFAFNGWGEKYSYPGDADLSSRIIAELGLPARAFPAVLEGGAVEVDGAGLAMTTRSCVLNSNRGGPRTTEELEKLLREALGIRKLLWLDQGLEHDHTDGHIDNAARFVAPGTVLHARAANRDDPQHESLQRIHDELVDARGLDGAPLNLLELPSPGPVLSSEGAPLPASYLNFYIANRSVAVPTYDSPHDRVALQRIAACFPGRRVVPIPSLPLLEEGGALHCITQPQPASLGPRKEATPT